MFLTPEANMKVVYELRRELDDNPDHVAQVQDLTLNKDKPLLGLKGTRGLFGSGEWWENINKGKLKTKLLTGEIKQLVFAGQDSRWGDQANSFYLVDKSGKSYLLSIRAHNKDDKHFFCVGANVTALYVLDELKTSSKFPLMKKQYSEILLELAVSNNLNRPNKSLQPTPKSGATEL